MPLSLIVQRALRLFVSTAAGWMGILLCLYVCALLQLSDLFSKLRFPWFLQPKKSTDCPVGPALMSRLRALGVRPSLLGAEIMKWCNSLLWLCFCAITGEESGSLLRIQLGFNLIKLCQSDPAMLLYHSSSAPKQLTEWFTAHTPKEKGQKLFSPSFTEWGFGISVFQNWFSEFKTCWRAGWKFTATTDPLNFINAFCFLTARKPQLQLTTSFLLHLLHRSAIAQHDVLNGDHFTRRPYDQCPFIWEQRGRWRWSKHPCFLVSLPVVFKASAEASVVGYRPGEKPGCFWSLRVPFSYWALAPLAQYWQDLGMSFCTWGSLALGPLHHGPR